MAWMGTASLKTILGAVLAVLLLASGFAAAQVDLPYQKPPKEILELADAAPPPSAMIDGRAKYMALLSQPRFLSLEELAQPELKLAGLRINPRAHDASRSRYYTTLAFQEVESGKQIPLAGLPENLRLKYPRFSPDSTHFSFVQTTTEGLELWVVDLDTGKAARLAPPVLTAVMGFPYLWSPDGKSLVCRTRPSPAPFPETTGLPTGPAIQEATGAKAAAWTYQDLLRNKNDERKFEFYGQCTITRYALDGTGTPWLPAGIYREIDLSPDGEYLLAVETHPPYSYQLPGNRFPYAVRVYDRGGRMVKELCDKPLQDKIPTAFDAVEDGPRDFGWRDDQPATLYWLEAADGGDPARESAVRDRVYQLEAPFAGEPRPVCATRNRCQGIAWGSTTVAVVYDFWWKTRNMKMYRINPDTDNPEPAVLFDFSSEDLYHQPGYFILQPDAHGRDRLLISRDGSKLYLDGEGYSPEGNRPFLDEFDLRTGQAKRLWQADGVKTYEDLIRVLDPEAGRLLTRIQAPAEYPNYYLRQIGSTEAPKAVTAFPNPYQSFAAVTKRQIHYKRADGLDLSATLYLPPGYDSKKDGRLPMLMEAYPTEFKDKAAAGQVDDSPYRFVSFSWGSPVFWAVRGYAVLEDAKFPIVGQGKEEPNDTYIEQLVMDAQAAITAVDTMGVVDPKRVGVMGHSYGAFMVANLLAHSDLFAAGIARSGAYNRSLTPFGFQAEERNYWQAQAVYQQMSPFNYADKIKAPLLLIHGDADNNPGTFTLQSERLFQAVKGLGGTARLVLLPYESHGYAARENILHMLWEMDTWLEKYVKGPAGK